MMMIRMAHCIAESVEKVLGRSYIRVSQPQVDHVAPLFPHLGEAHVHFRAEVTLKQV
jgi:hypothetical protein